MVEADQLPGERADELSRQSTPRGAGRPRLPYPSREAIDPIDAACLHAVELLSDPEWIARHWLPPKDPEET